MSGGGGTVPGEAVGGEGVRCGGGGAAYICLYLGLADFVVWGLTSSWVLTVIKYTDHISKAESYCTCTGLGRAQLSRCGAQGTT